MRPQEWHLVSLRLIEGLFLSKRWLNVLILLEIGRKFIHEGDHRLKFIVYVLNVYNGIKLVG